MKSTHILKIFLILTLSLFAIPVFAAANDFVSVVQDTAITGFIKTKMALDKTLTDANVVVTTNNGTVTLDGTVNSDVEAANLIQLAQSTSGVKEVDASKLKITKSNRPFSDIVTTAKVKGLFAREKLFDEKDIALVNIHVETNNGVVYLTGNAKNEQQINNAVALAKSVNGVTKVVSTVTVVKGS